MSVQFTCETCKKQFSLPPSRVKYYGGRFCSHYCRCTIKNATTTCSVGGCKNQLHRRDLCVVHYGRWQRHGHTDLVQKFGPEVSIHDRFWRRVKKTKGCWLWTGPISKFGYGVFVHAGKTYRVHRYSYEIHHGPLKDGFCACHHCDVRNCVKPSHLFAGTTQDNTNDMVQKKRHAYGSRNGTAKLTEESVREIRRQLASGVRVRELSIQWKVTPGTIKHIKQRRQWRHVV